MHIISNTSPILNLAIIGRLSLLRRQFGEILIPQAVFEELRTGENLPGSQAMRDAVRKGWIQIHPVVGRPLVQALQRELDKGEAEAIALASELKAERILLDERAARRVAKSLRLKVTGLLGVILRAHCDGEISSVSEIIEDLREKAGFRIDAKLLADVLKK